MTFEPPVQHTYPTINTPTPPVINWGVLPLIIVGFLVVMFGLTQAAWQADYQGAQSYNTATQWERLTGNDIPETLTDVERTEGYFTRRVIDGSVYVGIVFGVLCILALGVVNRAWVYVPLCTVGLYGLIYAATSGVAMGPLLTAGGFALVTFGAFLGWLTSSRTTGNSSSTSEGISHG